MSIELPKDAEGREIPLDTVALFNRVGNVYSIVRWTFTTDFDLSDGWSNKWRAITDRGFALDPALVYLTTPKTDTCEKLEEDLGRGAGALNYEACAYFGKNACNCSSCIADKVEIRKNDRGYKVGDKIVFDVFTNEGYAVGEAARHQLGGATY